MSADTTPTAPVAAPDDERFVKIPHAKPGQEYRAPKNVRQPLLDGFYRLVVTLLCLSLPIAPAVIFFMILVYSKAIQFGLLWLWISMIVIIEVIAISIAWGIAREALGVAGIDYSSRRR
ncbi:MAG TPA: hypothetical protein VE338_21695 [Ktedonobacterales bacterium]|nr:hypothetical protein [Ktedonobacterales bacterium]